VVVSVYEYFLPSRLRLICILISLIILSVCPLECCPPVGARIYSIPFLRAQGVTSLKSHKEACLTAATSCPSCPTGAVTVSL
jgi:hypothetical protein